MFAFTRASLHVTLHCRGYRPRSVTIKALRAWVKQFEPADRSALLSLVRHVRFVSESEFRRHLVVQYKAVMVALRAAGIGADRTIFLSIDDAGSSSSVALNLLRDAVGLERAGVSVFATRDVLGITGHLRDLTRGDGGTKPYAVVYVDDFVGTGNQLIKNRNFIAPYFVGADYTEYALVAVACEEAIAALGSSSIRPFAGTIHSKSERPLLPSSDALADTTRERLVALAHAMHPSAGLGYKGLATMVILYSNAPNTTPRLLTGDYRSNPPTVGLFPRTRDLPGMGIPAA